MWQAELAAAYLLLNPCFGAKSFITMDSMLLLPRKLLAGSVKAKTNASRQGKRIPNYHYPALCVYQLREAGREG
jgi:hypothetical protein